jgi:hypothetical protein
LKEVGIIGMTLDLVGAGGVGGTNMLPDACITVVGAGAGAGGAGAGAGGAGTGAGGAWTGGGGIVLLDVVFVVVQLNEEDVLPDEVDVVFVDEVGGGGAVVVFVDVLDYGGAVEFEFVVVF